MGAKAVLVVGATGKLGQMIAEQLLLLPHTSVRCLIRPGSEGKLGKSLRGRVEVVAGGIGDPVESLVEACRGASALVSAVQGGPDIIVDGQLSLLHAAREAGVSRFFPSDFSFDFFRLGIGENVNSDWRRQFAEASLQHRGPVAVHHVLNGCFTDLGVLFGFLGAFDLRRGTLSLWGDGQQPMDFTTYEDTARYTARAAIDASPPERVAVAGDVLNFWQLKESFERASGRALTVERHGTLADLDAEIAARLAAEPANMFAWLPLMYWRGMLSGKGKMQELVNAHFPEIKPTTVAQFVQDHRAQLSGGAVT